MKKLALILAAIFAAAAFTFTACRHVPPTSDVTNPVTPGQPTNPVTPENPDNPSNPSDTDEGKYTVKLTYNGSTVIPDVPVNVLWTDTEGFEVHSAPLSNSGVATVTGLDGDYKITLSAIPTGYTYNPNPYDYDRQEYGIFTTKNDRDKSIELLKLNNTSGSGSDYYENAIDMNSTGAFRVTISRSGQTVYFRYTPKESGVYSMFSMIDITANLVNPVLEVYTGSRAYVLSTPIATVDGGGSENTYTKNFRWEEMGLPSSSGGACFIFGVRAFGLNESVFPVNIDFYLDKDGEYDKPEDEYTPVNPEEVFTRTPEYPGKTFGYIAYSNPQRELREEDVKLWKKSEGGDGYYHLFNSETKEYGEILYAKINQDNEVLNTIEEGQTGTGSGFTYFRINKRINGKDYNTFINMYASYTNSDGVYAVTEELKIFLQEYCISQAIFNDGNGIAEVPDRNTGFLGYNSGEEDMWMFACGYYS